MPSVYEITGPTFHDEITYALSLDDVPLRDAVIGDRFVLVRGPRLAQTLYEVDSGTVRHIGTFDDPAEAMNALDAIDPS